MRRKTPIDSLLDAKRAKIVSTEKLLDKLKIEVATLERAREIVAAEDTPKQPNARQRTNGTQETRRGRSLSEGWKRVLATIAKKGEGGASLDEIFAYCGTEGITLQRPTLRAQMSNYVKRGYLGRTGEGNFFIALRGLEVAELNGETGK